MSLLFNLRARIKTFLNSSSVVCLFFVYFQILHKLPRQRNRDGYDERFS